MWRSSGHSSLEFTVNWKTAYYVVPINITSYRLLGHIPLHLKLLSVWISVFVDLICNDKSFGNATHFYTRAHWSSSVQTYGRWNGGISQWPLPSKSSRVLEKQPGVP